MLSPRQRPDNDTAARVSVIIPTKDRSALLRQALASVRALAGLDLDLEIVVADNGSTDDTERVADEYGARFVTTLTPGPAAARNVGLRAATGDYLAFLDDDDLWLPAHLRAHLALLRAHPEFGAVLGQIAPVDYALRPVVEPYPAALPADGDVFADFLTRWPQIGALVARASVLDSVGYFDESLIAGEEWDWHLRLALRYRVGFVAQPVLLFRVRPPGHANEDEIARLRVGYNRRVFWRNVRRAGGRRPPLRVIARAALKYDGFYAGAFVASSVRHAQQGHHHEARRALWLAFRTSPLHTLWALARRAEVRHVLLRSGAH